MSNFIAIGIDLGGTNIKAGLVTPDGTILDAASTPTLPHEGPKAVVGRMAKLALDLKAKALGDVKGIGVGSPGPLNPDTGTLYFAPNMPGWDDFPLGAELGKATGLNVRVENDANCAAVAEHWKGAGQGARAMILLTLGTGIGGGIVLDGKVLNGARVTAGEVGHIAISDGGPKCGCGSRGCLEAWCGTQGILDRARAVMEKPGTVTILRELAGKDYELLAPKLIGDAARKGDGVAISLWKETGRLLGIGIANLVNLFAPEVVVIGGGIGHGNWAFLEPAIRDEVKRRAMKPGNEQVRIALATAGNDAGLLGAGALIFRS
jgi:glucokinase